MDVGLVLTAMYNIFFFYNMWNVIEISLDWQTGVYECVEFTNSLVVMTMSHISNASKLLICVCVHIPNVFF